MELDAKKDFQDSTIFQVPPHPISTYSTMHYTCEIAYNNLTRNQARLIPREQICVGSDITLSLISFSIYSLRMTAQLP